MPKFWQSIEKNARMLHAVSVLGSEEVRKARPDGLTAEECYALLMSNQVCSSIPQAKSTVKELHYSGRLKVVNGLYRVVKEQSGLETPKAVDRLLKEIQQAKSADRLSVGAGETTNEGMD